MSVNGFQNSKIAEIQIRLKLTKQGKERRLQTIDMLLCASMVNLFEDFFIVINVSCLSTALKGIMEGFVLILCISNLLSLVLKLETTDFRWKLNRNE